MRGDRRSLRPRERHASRHRTGTARSRAAPARRADDICRARVSPAASPAERADLLAFYRSLRDKNNLTHEEAMRDSIVSVLMSPHFCYRLDLADGARRPSAPSPSAAERIAEPSDCAAARALPSLTMRWPAD